MPRLGRLFPEQYRAEPQAWGFYYSVIPSGVELPSFGNSAQSRDLVFSRLSAILNRTDP